MRKILIVGLLFSVNTCSQAVGTKVGIGNKPDLTVDTSGNIHVVYARDQKLYYKVWTAANGTWSTEEDTGLSKGDYKNYVSRSDPDIVVDSDGAPHVFAWKYFASKSGDAWKPIVPETGRGMRDTELAIDGDDTIYLVKRGGFGTKSHHIGLQKLAKGATSWQICPDPDAGIYYGSVSDHVYADLAINKSDNSIHIVNRHGPGRTTYYHVSTDGGKSFTSSKVCDPEPESPAIEVSSTGDIFVTEGYGSIYRPDGGAWIQEKKNAINIGKRDLPDFGADQRGNLYIIGFGGLYNIRRNGSWSAQKNLSPMRPNPIGFVECHGYADFAYILWEEGAHVDRFEKTSIKPIPVDIYIARLNSDGTLIDMGSKAIPNPIVFMAGDFSITQQAGYDVFYKHRYSHLKATDKQCLGIKPKGGVPTTAAASYVFTGKSGRYDIQLVTVLEEDGECEYTVKVADAAVNTVQNRRIPKTKKGMLATMAIGKAFINHGDIIHVEASTHSNGLHEDAPGVPAWARGRWYRLHLFLDD